MFRFYEKTGKYNKVHLIIFKSKLIKLFKMIKEMIKSSKKLSDSHKSVYLEIHEFSVHKVEVNDVSTLMRFLDFLIFYLHELNLTNLLLPAQTGFLDKMKLEY